MGPPHGFFQPGVPGPHLRPSQPQQNVSQPSPHSLLNQQNFISARYQGGPGSRAAPNVRLPQEAQPTFSGSQMQPMFADQLRPGVPHMMHPQRLPPGNPGTHARLAPMGQNNFPSNIRPMGNTTLATGMPPGGPLQRTWQSSGPGMQVANGPVGGPGTPIMSNSQNMPCDGAPPERYGMLQVNSSGQPIGVFPITSETGNNNMGEMMMNGDTMDIKSSPASSHGLNGGTPGPGGGGGGGGPNSVPPAAAADSCTIDYNSGIPFQSSDQEAEIQKIKESICEESKLFESKDAVASDGPNDFFSMH